MPSRHSELAVSDEILLPYKLEDVLSCLLSGYTRRKQLLYESYRKNPARSGGSGWLLEVVESLKLKHATSAREASSKLAEQHDITTGAPACGPARSGTVRKRKLSSVRATYTSLP